jgi:hypothetical protein
MSITQGMATQFTRSRLLKVVFALTLGYLTCSFSLYLSARLFISKLHRRKLLLNSGFNIILKTWSDIVSDQPMFWSDMIGHLIILKRDVVSCYIAINQNRNNYQKSKTICICIMVNKITQYQRQLT